MAISDLLASFLQRVGLKTTDVAKWEKEKQLYFERKALNQDRLDELKGEIGRLERKILKKKSEHEEARGDTKRIIGREIEQLFQELDLTRGREDILIRNIEQIALALAKIEEILVGLKSGIEESVLDELALEVHDMDMALQAGDKAERDLRKEGYKRVATDTVDIDARLEALEADVAEEADAIPSPQTAPQREIEPTEGLSASTRDRLKELEAEE